MKLRRRYSLLLLLLAPLLCLAIFCSAQAGLLLVRPDRLAVVIGPRTTADYSKWAYVLFRPVNPVLGTAVAIDRGAPTPPEIALAPTKTATPNPSPGPAAATQTRLAPNTQSTLPQPTLTPVTTSATLASPTLPVSVSPSVTLTSTEDVTSTVTSTLDGTPTLTSTTLSSDTPEPIASPTDTALPSVTNTPPQPITATFGPTLTPSFTLASSRTPRPSATLSRTRTLPPSATPIVVIILPTSTSRPPTAVPPSPTPRPPSSIPPSATSIPPSATGIPPSQTAVPPTLVPSSPTPIPASFTPIPPSPTVTLTPTDTPTVTPTPTDTPPFCMGNMPPGEPNVGPPNGIYYYVPCNGAVIVDLGTANPLTPGNFLVYYEALDVDPTAIALDQVIVEVGATPGGPWHQVFYWGDNILDANTNIGQQGMGGPSGEPDNFVIAATNPPLYGSSPFITGITIDVYAVAPPGTYRYVRIREPSGLGNISVDAVQVVPNVLQNLNLSAQCSPDPAAYRVWKVRNFNLGPLAFTWQLFGSSQSGSGVVPAAVGVTPGSVTFTSITEAGPNTMQIFVSGVVQDTKASNNSVCAPSATPNPSMTSTPTSTSVASADLGIMQSANPPAPSQGSAFNYLLTLTNAGPASANGIQVNDLLPGGVTFINANPSQGTYDSVSGLWTVGSLPIGTSATLQLNVTLNNGTLGQTITNTANISGAAETDPNSSNNVSSLSFLVLSSPGLRRSSPTPIPPSATLTNPPKPSVATITPASMRRIVTPTFTWTVPAVPSPTPQPPTATPIPATAIPSATRTASATATPTLSAIPPSRTPTATSSATATSANVVKVTLAPTLTRTPTPSFTPLPPTPTPTATLTTTLTATLTSTPLLPATPTPTASPTL